MLFHQPICDNGFILAETGQFNLSEILHTVLDIDNEHVI